ncbi:hypothetical protein CO165_02925 [Candidatus Roizmanbacteria bacterium CG_4_9_14_3_um_filter_33_18]|uniref:DUF192 domain-containing protein n=1 Tax=Candidatus Roizmanbacteria bacterium CG_4_9_14_3_um_filter_33_18 TaxID=1974841 RepID=A0A2M7XXU6_9BACT|nr:MAG: hypothetical protein CO165_02925 [Candidatus Roizmanbacteria bacterium CG_4_9_14_3_um_filter_33_18]
MKRIIFIMLFFTVVTCYFVFKNNNCQNNQAKKYSINNKNYCLLIADSQDEWEKGLMFYKKPLDFDGMIFIFPDKRVRSFWNKNTYLDLDLYWMDEDKVVNKSYLPLIIMTKNPLTVSSPREVDRVVEIIR